jgi:exopolysaccharide production protein ExoZ
MEGLRGIAVLLVFFVHFSSRMERFLSWDEESIWWIHAIREIGNSGVDLFFVLSGFLIYKAIIHRPPNYPRYAYRRVERIYPVFLAVLSIYVALGYLLPEQFRIPAALPDALPYIAANVLFLPGIFAIKPIITVAWSLSYEALYYILVPVVTSLLVMRHWRSRHRIAFFVGVYLFYIAAQALGPAPHFRLTMFLGGILLYEVAYGLGVDEKRAGKTWIDWLSLALFVVGLACSTLLGESRWMLGETAAAGIPEFLKFVILNGAFVLLVHRCLFAAGPATRLFSFGPLRWLGNMSYTYYLMHYLGLYLFFLALGKLAPTLQGSVLLYCGLIPVAIILTLGLSVPVYLFIERPFSLKPAPVALSRHPANTSSRHRGLLNAGVLREAVARVARFRWRPDLW